jgi:signal transduction histidine kinase
MDTCILVVDDSQPIRDFVVQSLADKAGIVTLEASNGAEGLEMALANSPDLILLDFEMPLLTGSQVLDKLHEQKANIPVILITSHGSEAIAVEFFRKGVKDYLMKPFTARELYTAIERALIEVHLQREKDALTQQLSISNQQLWQRVRELDALCEMGKSVTSLLPKDQLLDRIFDAVFTIIDPEEATLMLVDEGSGRLETEHHRERVSGETRRITRRSAGELAAQAARKGDSTASRAMLANPLKVGDRVIGVLGVANHVSARPFTKQDQQLLQALADYATVALENVRLYEQVRQADQAKSEFISLVVTELDAPKSSAPSTEILVNPLTDQLQKYVHTILDNTQQMQLLISNLRDVSLIETGQCRLETKTVSLTELLEGVLQAMRGRIEARSQRLTVEIAENLPPIHVDPTRLTQILINLLDNAHRYTPQDGHIHVRAWLKDAHVHCVVSDTGVGISPDDQAKLCEKFFRSADPTVQACPGMGLGLYVVKHLVELHHGEIEVRSQLGRGTAVLFTIPAQG